MNWINKDSKPAYVIKFLQKGVRRKYTLTIKGEIQMGTLNTSSLSQTRWVLNVLNNDNNGYDLELLTLDNTLLECNNPSLKDIDALNNLFKQIYNELQFRVTNEGKIEKITNLDQIKTKWKQVRTQLVEIQGQFVSIAQVLQLNDNLFNNDKLLYDSILATEFFEWYTGLIYGRKVPGSAEIHKKSRFQTADVSWLFEYEKKLLPQDIVAVNGISITGKANHKQDLEWFKKAYGHFPYIEVNRIKPEFTTTADYFIDENTALITEAIIKTEEIVHPGLLYSKMHYHIKSDDITDTTVNTAADAHEKTSSNNRFSTLI